MDFLNDFFREIDRARGMYKTVGVIYDYLWPIIIIIGVLFAIIFIRSYLHGRDIKKLKRGAIGNFGQGGTPIILNNCQDVKILQATPDVARMLTSGQQLPRPPQALSPGKNTHDESAVVRSAEKRRIEEAERIRREAEEEKRKRWSEESRKEKSDRAFELATGHPPKNPKSAAYKKRAEEERQKVLREQAIEKEKRRQVAQVKLRERFARVKERRERDEKERAEKEKAEGESRRKDRKGFAKAIVLLVIFGIPYILITVIKFIVKVIQYITARIKFIRSRIQDWKAKKQTEVKSPTSEPSADDLS